MRFFSIKLIIMLSAIMSLIFFVACSDDDINDTVEVIHVTGVSIGVQTEVLTLLVDETHSLVTTLIPENATNKNVTYISSNPVIASVDVSTGVITALSPGDTITITATSVDGGYTSQRRVLVIKTIPPSLEYIKEGDACLNVFYAIPSDLDTVSDWHKRLSGITLHIQEYFKTNFEKAGYGAKTFNLEINKTNPKYIKIHYLSLDETTSAVQKVMIDHATEKAVAYYKENNLSSKNSLIYLPKYPDKNAANAPANGNYYKSEGAIVQDMGFGVLAVDHVGFDIKHFGETTQFSMLSGLSAIIHELAHGFWIQHHDNGMDKKNGMMGYAVHEYLNKPNEVWFAESAIFRMNELSIFNKESSGDSFNFDPWANEIGIKGNKEAQVKYEEASDEIVIDWNFKSTKKVVGFMAYIDPWFAKSVTDDMLSRDQVTDYDATTYLASNDEFTASGNDYSVSMRIKWQDFVDRNKLYNNIEQGEVRFRIIFQGGATLPESGAMDNKGPLPTSSYRNTIVRFHFTMNGIPVFDNETYHWY